MTLNKDKVHPRSDHEGPEREQRYSCTLSLTSALGGGVGGQRHAPAALPLQNARYRLNRRLSEPSRSVWTGA